MGEHRAFRYINRDSPYMEWTDLPEVGAVAGQAAAKGKSVTSRALNILGAFDAGHVKLTLSEISRRSDTPVATCHRLLGELLEWGQSPSGATTTTWATGCGRWGFLLRWRRT